MEMVDKNNFFEENDKKVNVLTCKILLWLTIVFPILFVLSILGIFSVSIHDLCIITPLACICTISPTIVRRRKASTKFIKYYSVIALSLVIGIMASNAHIGIYITFVLSMAISCLYFDMNFTKRISILGLICLIVAVFIRSKGVTLQEGETSLSWFRAYVIGYIIEYVAMSAVFMCITKMARHLLESIHDTEKVKIIVSKCDNASGKLVESVSKLNKAIETSSQNNDKIVLSAEKTLSGCNENLDQVSGTVENIKFMSDIIGEIGKNTEDMIAVSKNTCKSTDEYIKIMDGAVDSMNKIEETSEVTHESVKELQDTSREITKLTEIVKGIATQTNLLALNASIEAARAGEAGKGFAVVADEVKELAEQSQDAVSQITNLINKVMTSVDDVAGTLDISEESVKDGISRIANAKVEAEKINNLQLESQDKIVKIAERCSDSMKYVDNVVDKSKNIKNIVNQSLLQVTVITDSMHEQVEMMNSIQNIFVNVDDVANDLRKVLS